MKKEKRFNKDIKIKRAGRSDWPVENSRGKGAVRGKGKDLENGKRKCQ